MNTKKLLTIIGFIIGPLIPLTIAVYFLFPYLNEEKYEEVAKMDSTEVAAENEIMDAMGGEGEPLAVQTEALQKNNRHLQRTVDSLRSVNDSLETELAAREDKLEELTAEIEERKDKEEAQSLAKSLYEEDNEEFKENIKSFLSLDDENLAPIINQMSDDQLVRLYRGGSSLHRKKLLRTLESKRAAQLITEVM